MTHRVRKEKKKANTVEIPVVVAQECFSNIQFQVNQHHHEIKKLRREINAASARLRHLKVVVSHLQRMRDTVVVELNNNKDKR